MIPREPGNETNIYGIDSPIYMWLSVRERKFHQILEIERKFNYRKCSFLKPTSWSWPAG